MMNPEIEDFARILVQQVRDEAIKNCDMTLRPDAKDIIAKRWRKAAGDSSPEEFARAIIPDIVDSTIAALLWAIDQELLRLSFAASSGKSIDLAVAAPGELTGWYTGGEDSWRMKYSKERFVDDNADLRDFFTRPEEGDRT